VSKRRRRKAATPTRANLLPTKYTEPKKLIEQLLEHLIRQVPIHELPSAIARKSKSSRIDEETAALERFYDDCNVAAGKEDLVSGFADLSDMLDSIGDNEERHRAYVALYRAINGAFLVAKSGILPLSVEQHSQVAHARVMRWRRKQSGRRTRSNVRRDIVLAAIAEYKNEKPKRMLERVNDRLAEAGQKTIEIRQLYRYFGKR